MTPSSTLDARYPSTARPPMVWLLKTWNRLRRSYWFLPTLMSLLAALLAFALTAIDGAIGSAWVDRVAFVYPIQTDGARALLTTVAGSMIGVAGVTFSITIAALSYTTSTLGPRLLNNFMNDTGNQVTLGTFLATAVYCLLILRAMPSGAQGVAFEAHLSLLFAMVLAVAGLAVLIYFIHHITDALNVSNVVGAVAHDLDVAIDNLIAQREAAGGPSAAELPGDFDARAVAITAGYSGYIQNLIFSALMHRVEAHDLVLRLERVPGDFVAAGQTLIRAWPAENVDDACAAALAGAFATGRSRTASQDIGFVVNELVEIAARALSPGVNDPYTAMGCLDWLMAALIRFLREQPESAHRYDDNARLRIFVPAYDFETLANAIFDQLRPYFASDRNAALHMLGHIAALGEFTHTRRQRAVLLGQAEAVRQNALHATQNERDQNAITRVHERATRCLAQPTATGCP